MPFWPFWPLSNGWAILVISVATSAISRRRRMRVAAGDDDVLVAGAVGQGLDDVVDVEPAPLDEIGELVEDIEPCGSRRRGGA
jgi:hypothetical protein